MEFTHFDPGGKAWMVDVGGKEDSRREAVAEGTIRMSGECFERVTQGGIEKGDVLGAARIAGIMGAKKTAELIPLCHLLNLTKLSVDFDLLPDKHAVRAVCTAGTVGKTGAEMEALTVYDMCKAVDKAMEIGEIRLVRKSGGKSGDFMNPNAVTGEE